MLWLPGQSLAGAPLSTALQRCSTRCGKLRTPFHSVEGEASLDAVLAQRVHVQVSFPV